MSKKMTPIAAALGTAFALSLATAPVSADTANPFGMTDLSSGYQQVAEGKCGAGKCGGESKKKESKCGSGKCGAGKKADSKSEDGKCGAKKKEAKCGAGKCGGSK